MAARKDGLVEGYAGQAGSDRGLRNSLRCGLLFEVFEPGFKRAGAAGRRECRRCRRQQQCAQRDVSKRKARGHGVVRSKVDSLSTLVLEPYQMFGATAAKTRLLFRHRLRERVVFLDAQFVGSRMASGYEKPPV